MSPHQSKASNLFLLIKSQKYLSLILFLLFSAVLNSINLFRFQVDSHHKYIIFPILNEAFFNFNFVYSYLNILFIVFNHFFMIIIQFFLNILLFYFTKPFISDQKKLINPEKSEKKKSNNVQRRTTIMIFLSGVSLLMMHFPDFIISVYLATLFIYVSGGSLKNIYEIGLFEYSSQFYYDLASFLYFIHYSFYFLFFILFDKNFRKQFYSLFSKQKSK
jgi:hypothetical protein